VLSLSPETRIFMAAAPIDMRRYALRSVMRS
jgi:hypothetical protein